MKGYAVGEVAEYLHPYEEVVRLTEAQAEIDEAKGHMAWALKLLYDQEKGNPIYFLVGFVGFTLVIFVINILTNFM